MTGGVAGLFSFALAHPLNEFINIKPLAAGDFVEERPDLRRQLRRQLAFFRSCRRSPRALSVAWAALTAASVLSR